jgi:hypothetical protein
MAEGDIGVFTFGERLGRDRDFVDLVITLANAFEPGVDD